MYIKSIIVQALTLIFISKCHVFFLVLESHIMKIYKDEPVVKRIRSKIVNMKTSKEPAANSLRSKIINMEPKPALFP